MLCAKRFMDISNHQHRVAGNVDRFLAIQFVFHSREFHGKKIRINLTRMTSAKITNREDNTTELVAERPTPSVPPRVRIPWKLATRPMIRPKTEVLNVGARKSLKATPEKPLFKKRCREIGSVNVTAIHPPHNPQKSVT